MPHAEVEITVGDEAPGDEVTFLLAANPGCALLPLSRVASGGELARTMLALRLVLTEAPETLVFDEVDAGIGGAAATAVGESLARLGDVTRCWCVTHLAQVAALADTQIMVTKTVAADSERPTDRATARSRRRRRARRRGGPDVEWRPRRRVGADCTPPSYSVIGCALRSDLPRKNAQGSGWRRRR